MRLKRFIFIALFLVIGIEVYLINWNSKQLSESRENDGNNQVIIPEKNSNGNKLSQYREKARNNKVAKPEKDYDSLLKSRMHSTSIEKYLHDILHNFKNIHDCDDLFKNTTEEEFFKDTDYFRMKSRHNELVKRITLDVKEKIERRVFYKQQMLYYALARLPFVQTICEIGFNTGDNAFLWLTANQKVKVYSFDLGNHEYTHHIGSYLMNEFPGRFNLTIGPPVNTVPKTARSQNLKCDILTLDGEKSYHIALKNLLNMKKLANPDKNILIFDDYPNIDELVRAWDNAQKQIEMIQHMSCQFSKSSVMKGFVIGGYIL